MRTRLLPLLACAALLAAGAAVAQEVRRPLLDSGIFGHRGGFPQSDERSVRGRLYRATDLEPTRNVNGALASSYSPFD